MKKKEIKKLAKVIVKEGKEYERRRYEVQESKENKSDFIYCEYDENISEKFVKFVLSLIKLKEKLIIEFYENEISIYGDLNKMKNKNQNYSEESFDVKIDRTGFKVRRNYLTYVGYQDPYIFDSLKEKIIQKSKLISKDIINETIDDLCIELNLSRENNLEEILK